MAQSSPVNDFTFVGAIEAPSFSADLLESGWLADVVIQCRDRTWKGHKLVLCGQSNWFKEAFSGNFSEAKTGVVDIVGFTVEEVDVLLKFLYSGRVEVTGEFNENTDNPFIVQMRLLHLAKSFQVPRLGELVCKALQKHKLALREQLCRLPTAEDPAPFRTASVQLFAAIEELYGKYDMQGQYPECALSVKRIIKKTLSQLLVCNVHEVVQVPSFKTLLQNYGEFAVDWAFTLTEVACTSQIG